MSRLRFLYPLAAVVAAAAMMTALVACGGDDSSDANPQQVVDRATLQGIDSGNIDLALKVKAEGENGGEIDVSLSGPFQGADDGGTPRFDLTAKAEGSAEGDDIDFEGGLVLLPNTAFVTYEGVDYEVDPTTFSFVESAIRQAQQQEGGGNAGDASACQEAFGELQVAEFSDNLSTEGSADVGGADTTHVSGDLDVSGAIDALVGVARSPACRSQLGPAGALLSEGQVDEAKEEVDKAVKTAHVELYVGDDDIVRRLAAQVEIEPEGGDDGPQSVEIEFDLQLTDVNQEQEISAPADAEPLNELFLKLGVNPVELLGLLQGEAGGEGLGNLLEGLGGGGAGGGGSGGGGNR